MSEPRAAIRGRASSREPGASPHRFLAGPRCDDVPTDSLKVDIKRRVIMHNEDIFTSQNVDTWRVETISQ